VAGGTDALSLVSKSYKAYFEPEDADNDEYELPVSPVLGTPAITVSMNGVSTTFQQKGSRRVRVYPDRVFGTIQVGASDTSPYLEVTFQAGATNESANSILLELVSIMFNHRDGGVGVSYSRLPFDLQQRINMISNNL
jgi:hypothetical protein